MYFILSTADEREQLVQTHWEELCRQYSRVREERGDNHHSLRQLVDPSSDEWKDSSVEEKIEMLRRLVQLTGMQASAILGVIAAKWSSRYSVMLSYTLAMEHMLDELVR
jgi:hypothetical protein